MDKSDLRTLEDLVEKIYIEISNGTTPDGDGSTGTTIKKERELIYSDLRTGIKQIDNAVYSYSRTTENIENFGSVLEKTGIKGIKGFGSALQKYAGAISGVTQIVQAGIELYKGIISVKNVKTGATVTAARRDIAENELQFTRDSQLNTLDTQQFVEGIELVGDMALKSLEASGSVMIKSLQIMAEAQVKSVETAVGSITDGINETAYAAAEYQIERGKELKILDIEKEKTFKELDLYANLKTTTYERSMDLLQKQREVTQSAYEGQSAKNAIDKAIEVREAESDVALKDLVVGTTVGALGGGGTGALIGGASTSWSGPAALIGAGVGAGVGTVAGGAIGLNKALGDETGKQAYQEGKNLSGNMNNVFNNGGFKQSQYNFQNDPRILGKWERGLFKEFNEIKREETLKLAIDKFSSDIKMTSEGNRLLTENSNKIQNEILQKQTDVQTKSLELQTEALKIQEETKAKEEKMWLKLTQATERWLDNFDKSTNDLGKSLGFTNRQQLDKFQQSMIVAATAAAKFGKTYEDVVKIQHGFAETTGRNRMFNEEDINNSLRLSEYLGGDTGLVSSYISGMEIFNAGVSDSIDMLDEVLVDVNRIGLNGRKYTKTLVDNLKLAQKYNFKDGTKGLMKMAKWAENTRFNLASLGGMLDKVSEGGLEGVITQSAQLQVLGGHAAMNADPLAMLWERYNDQNAFAKRMQDMTKGYGHFDKETGETTFNMNEQILMENIAKAQGRPVEEVMNEARARVKKENVTKQIRGNFDEDQQSFISNNATYDKKTGEWKVNVMGADGKYHETEVSQLTPDDLEDIMPLDYQEHMLKNMDTLVDYAGQLAGAKESQQAKLGGDIWQSRIDNYRERMDISNEMFLKNYDEYLKNIKEKEDFITESYGDLAKSFGEATDNTSEEVQKIVDMTNKIANALGDTAAIIQNANAFASGNKEKIADLPTYQESQKSSDLTNALDDYANHTIGHNVDDLHNIMKKIVDKYETGSRTYEDYVGFLKEGYNDLLDSMAAATGRGDSSDNYNMSDVEELVKSYKRNYMKDGIINNNNKPIVSQATNVTKINDGFVQSDPKDVAIFAKEGGVIGNFLNDLYNDVHSSNSGSIKLDTINVSISGSLDLSSGGQSVNIINELQNDPILLRSLSRMLAEHISKSMNGGRGNSNLNIGSV